MTDYVLGFAFDIDTNKVLLLEKLTPIEQKGLLNGIGGKIELFEDEYQAMIREFFEETGISTIEQDWLKVGTMQYTSFSIHLFTTTVCNIYKARSTTAEQVNVYDLDFKLLEQKGAQNLSFFIKKSLNFLK